MFRHPDGRVLVQSLLSQEHTRQTRAAASAPRSMFSVLSSLVSGEDALPTVSFVDGDEDGVELCKSWASWIRNGGALSNDFSTEGLSVRSHIVYAPR